MARMSGWQKAGLVAGVGCLSIIGVIIIGVIIAVSWARSTVAQYGDTTPTRVERTITLPGPAPAIAAEAGAPPAAAAGDEPLLLRVDLQEGSFTIQPGPSGTQVQVEGTFAESLYELTESTDAVENGGAQRTTVRFRSKAPAWARILSGIGNDGSQPRLTVRIPQGRSIDLSLRVAMGESRIDLGGLTLSGLGLDLSMGNHEIDFQEPVVEGLRRVRLDAQMGNVSIDNLGNTRAEVIDASGRMGNLSADLGGAWQPGSSADLSFTQSMGQLRLDVPSKVRLETTVSSSMSQASEGRAEIEESSDPKAPVLRLRVSTSMGESRVNRY